jgi:hypothetical protein
MCVQADGIFKYPEIAYANGIRLTNTPLASPALSSVPGMFSALPSTGNTPVHAQQSFRARSQSQDSNQAPNGRNGIASGCESSSVDGYEKHSLSGGQYLHDHHDCGDMNLEHIDFGQVPQRDIERSELDGSEMDAFVQLLAADTLLDQLQPGDPSGAGGAPKYSKKRSAVKKSSKGQPTTPATNASATTESHEEVGYWLSTCALSVLIRRNRVCISVLFVVHGGGHMQVLPAAVSGGHGRPEHELRDPEADPHGAGADAGRV